MDLDEHSDLELFHTSLSYFFFSYNAFLFSLSMLCKINLSLKYLFTHIHVYQGYVYNFSLIMIEICVI